jgi:large subunit ribosomal protein LP0
MIASQKVEKFKKILDYLEKFHKAFLIDCNNVGSKQFQSIRRAIRESSIILMGKNTLIKRCLRSYFDKCGASSNKWCNVPNFLVGNVGLLLTKGDMNEVREILSKFKVGAPARIGAIAPCDVTVNSGATGMDPSATTFFQALNIPTKINKGTVEIIKEMTVVKAGERVGGSSATLLAKLGIRPFSYGLTPVTIFEDGMSFDASVLDIKNNIVHAVAVNTIMDLLSLSLNSDEYIFLTMAHVTKKSLENILTVSITTKVV